MTDQSNTKAKGIEISKEEDKKGYLKLRFLKDFVRKDFTIEKGKVIEVKKKGHKPLVEDGIAEYVEKPKIEVSKEEATGLDAMALKREDPIELQNLKKQLKEDKKIRENVLPVKEGNKTWYCEKCGANVPGELVEKAALGEVPKHKIKKCPSCKRAAGVFDFKPTEENLKKFWAEWHDNVFPSDSKKNVKKSMEMTKEDAIEENKKLAELRKDVTKEELKKDTEKGLAEEQKKINKATLKEVYKVTEKWLGIKIKDRNRIDVILATVLSNQIVGTPIWIFIVGASGDWKTSFCSSLDGLNNVIKIDQMTKNTLASGQKDVEDLGKELHNASKILLFLDLASLTSSNNDEKNVIWGQFRTLYDGDIYKRTGNGVNKAYDKCHVTIVACTTPTIRNEILIHAQLGTRELMYDTVADPIDNDFKMDKAIENEKYEEQMKKEIGSVVKDFVTYHKVKDIEIPEEIIKFLKTEAKRLTILRASGMVDRIYKELINPIDPEVPTRLIKQFIRLWRCLKSLDDNYPDEKAKKIISHIVNSSGDKVRQMILELLKNNSDKAFKIPDVQAHTRLGRKSVKGQLEMLWNLRVLEKDVRVERIGGAIVGYDENERQVGGRIEEIPYYRYSTVNPHPPPTHETQTRVAYTRRGEKRDSASLGEEGNESNSDNSDKKIPLLEEMKKIKEYIHGFDNDKIFVCKEEALFANFTPSTITNLFESGQIKRNSKTQGVEWND